MKSQKKKVFVGLSGGVDSSVAAALLKEQGYDVTGVYMKNWSKDLPGFPCPWKEDYQDAKRVAVKLGIPFELFDFETEYFDYVVQYMLDGFRAGRVVCMSLVLALLSRLPLQPRSRVRTTQDPVSGLVQPRTTLLILAARQLIS
jgi:NH3-dependent NAD+ synthetase